MTFSRSRILIMAVLIAVALACALVGGPTFPPDLALIRAGIAARAASPVPTEAGVVLNIVGGVAVTLGVTIVASVLLWARRGGRRATALFGVVVSGRLLIEAIKNLVGRARPALDAHPVVTHSLSFPSGHAGNSMMAFTALALFLTRPALRPWAIGLAVLASLIVGASRSLIGVHWPTDVLAGWSIGAAWVLLTWPLAQRLAPDQPKHDVVRGHGAALIED